MLIKELIIRFHAPKINVNTPTSSNYMKLKTDMEREMVKKLSKTLDFPFITKC